MPSAGRQRHGIALAALLPIFACNALLDNAPAEVGQGARTSTPDGCVPRQCAADSCGVLDDGCGGTLSCSCGEGSVCNGTRCVCATTACNDDQCNRIERSCGKPLECGSSCARASYECVGNACVCQRGECEARCGTQPDGCDGELACPGCSIGETCGGEKPDVCGQGTCVPRTCDSRPDGKQLCGRASNGCGGPLLDCIAACPPGLTCGGGGEANVCGCTPTSCERLGIECGSVPNNCPGQPNIDCGSCADPQTCGGGGVANVCGCTPRTCGELNVVCDNVDDGCGNKIPCGTCPPGQFCVGGQCAPNCVPDVPAVVCAGRCGKVPDRCGGTIECQCPGLERCSLDKTCCPVGRICADRCCSPTETCRREQCVPSPPEQ